MSWRDTIKDKSEVESQETESSWRDTIQDKEQEMSPETKGLTTGAGIAAAQNLKLPEKTLSSANRATKQAGKLILRGTGKMNQDDLDFILKNPDALKNVPNMSEILDKAEDFDRKIAKAGIQAKENARRALADKSIPVNAETIKKDIKNVLSSKSEFDKNLLKKVNKTLGAYRDFKPEDLPDLIDDIKQLTKPNAAGLTHSQSKLNRYVGELSDRLKFISPDFENFINQSAKSFRDREVLKEVTGLKGKALPQGRKATTSSAKKIKNIKFDEDTVRMLTRFEEIAEEYGDPELAKQIRAKGLDALIDANTGLFRKGILSPVVGSAIAAEILGFPSGVATGTALARESYGTKAQQKIAETAGKVGEGIEGLKNLLTKFGETKLGKTGRVLGKGVYKSLPLLGGFAAYNEAQAKDLPIEQAIPYIAAETISPLPFSGIQAKEFMEEEAPIRQKEAREQMSANFPEPEDRALRTLPKTDEEKQYDSYIMKATVDQLQNIASELETIGGESAQGYANVLRQMTDMKPQKRAAVSFGLEQQPAFRKLMEKQRKKEK